MSGSASPYLDHHSRAQTYSVTEPLAQYRCIQPGILVGAYIDRMAVSLSPPPSPLLLLSVDSVLDSIILMGTIIDYLCCIESLFCIL
jgi:hypothetical protein